MTAQPTAQHAVVTASRALHAGNRAEAYRWAAYAARLDPTLEQPWLILASLAEPQASIDYLKRALAINPNSEAARKGMHWAAQRLRSAEEAQVRATPTQPVVVKPVAAPIPAAVPQQSAPPPSATQPVAAHRPAVRKGLRLRPALLLAVALFAAVTVLGLSGVWMVMASNSLGGEVAVAMGQVVALFDPTTTPTLTATALPTATLPPPTATATATATEVPPTATPTLPPTATNTPEPTLTPVPVNSPTPTETLPPPPTETPVPVAVQPPDGVAGDDHWIDVDLSDQMAYAYAGDTLVNSFLVSTGTWDHPTVTGEFAVYVKYRYADMSGPGYYLPDVPYVMYFYKDYGLHGTYWHNNFGTPMSHGCVNFRTEDAGWVFDWSSVGTPVIVHD